jgi:hypothetical protein
VSNKIYVGNLSTYGGAVRAVYRWSSSNELAHWTGAFAARTNVTPWVPPADPYAILNVPIVTYTGAGFTVPELGFSMENFATVAPLAVALDAAGQPEGELRVNAVVAYLLQIIKDLNRRLTLLGGMP